MESCRYISALVKVHTNLSCWLAQFMQESITGQGSQDSKGKTGVKNSNLSKKNEVSR